MTFLLATTVRISIILLVALCSLRFMKRRSAAVRHCALSAAALLAISTPILSVVLPKWKPGFATLQPLHQVPQGQMNNAPFPITSVLSSRNNVRKERFLVQWLWFAIWLGGVAAGMFVLFAGWWRIHQVIAASRPITQDNWAQLVEMISAEYGLRSRIRLLESHNSSIVVTWGAFRPCILLPRGAADWRSERVRSVLRHELAHIYRLDLATQMLAQLLRVMLWFNPLVWITLTRLRFESELACDDMAISAGVDRWEYASQLLDVARELNFYEKWPAAVGMAERPSLERRFEAMMNPSILRHPATVLNRSIIVLVFACVALPSIVVSTSASSEFEVLPPLGPAAKPSSIPLPPAHSSVTETGAGVAVQPASSAESAPQISGGITGTVTDRTGTGISGATVLVSAPLTGVEANRIETARKNRDNADSESETEVTRFKQGVSTLRSVFEAERRAAQAKAEELEATISVLGRSRGEAAQTDSEGKFVVSGLQPGSYSVRVFSAQTGFSGFIEVEVKSGEAVHQDFRVAIQQETVGELKAANSGPSLQSVKMGRN